MSDPVQQVNWYHAIAFCNKLSIAEELDPVYSVSGVTDWGSLSFVDVPDVNDGEDADWNAADADWGAEGYRLPTEMEWMWAAMGADQDSQSGAMQNGVNVTGYTKAFAGDDGTAGTHIDDYAWYGEDSSTGSTHPAGGKNANELGLHDMSGNVWEWCWDWSAAYPTGEQTDYRGPAPAANRVIRGGCYANDVGACTTAYRHIASPADQHYGLGFRVVRP
jgi:formylglycine-generating enzyme required for sulfatase activity